MSSTVLDTPLTVKALFGSIQSYSGMLCCLVEKARSKLCGEAAFLWMKSWGSGNVRVFVEGIDLCTITIYFN